MAGVKWSSMCYLLTGVWSLYQQATATMNPEWCSRQCTCLNSYDTVDCTHKHLTKVPELSNLTTNLYLDSNDITKVDEFAFRNLENLVVLNLEDNKIGSLSSDHLCGLQKLRILNLSGNNLTSLNISDNITKECTLPALRQLVLSSNKLTALSANLPQWAPALETLNASYNEIMSVMSNESFSNLQSLRVLDLRGNKIERIMAQDLLALKKIPLNTLILSECDLYQVEPEAFEGMTELVSLSLSRNVLSSETLVAIFNAIGYNSQLGQLDLREMYIPNVTTAMLGMLHGLTNLDMFESSIKYIEPELLYHLPDLETLNVGRNEIHNLTNLSALKKLRRLYAGWNHLKSINLTDLHSLEIIDLGGNKLETLPSKWLGYKANLLLLNVSHNEITTIMSDSLQNLSLQVLDLSYNKITELDGTGLLRIRKMYLGHNRLSTMTPRTYDNLSTTLADLDISYNNLTKLPDRALKDFVVLQELNLGQNSLGQALKDGGLRSYFKNMGHLQKLDLSGNGITSIAKDQFRYLHHLTTIDLSYNSVTNLGEVALHELTTLARLDITNNLIRSVDANVLQRMEYLEEVDLGNNPFNCTECAIEEFLKWCNKTVVLIINQSDHDKYQCHSPWALTGQYLFDYLPSSDSKHCRPPKDLIQSELDWAMIIVALVGVTVFLTLGGLLLFYTQICHKIKNLHYRWQIRYREVSGVEFTNDPKV